MKPHLQHVPCEGSVQPKSRPFLTALHLSSTQMESSPPIMEHGLQSFAVSDSLPFSSASFNSTSSNNSSHSNSCSNLISSPDLSISDSVSLPEDSPKRAFTHPAFMDRRRASSFEEEMYMDPVLEFVNNMLMDEKMEDQTCMEMECLRYQAIANGFYEILNERDSSDSSWKAGSSDSGSRGVSSDAHCTEGSSPEVKSDAKLEAEWAAEADLELSWLQNVLAPEFPEFASPHIDAKFVKTAETGNGKSEYPWQRSKPPALPASAQQMIRKVFEQLGGLDELPANIKEQEPVPAEDHVLSFVRNGDLKAEEDAKLYRQWSSLPEWKEGGTSQKKKKKKRRNGEVEVVDELYSVDLRGMLVSCAQAVAAMDVQKANGMLAEIRGYANPCGSAAQRMAHHFADALAARLAGTGGKLFTASSIKRPSAAKMLKTYNLMFAVCPFVRVAHYFANHSILKAAEGAARLHIIDYGILYGIQWPSLISALAERPGGPPFLHITGIEFPQPGPNPAARVEQTGVRLAEYAKTYHVPFKYHAIADQWEDIDRSALLLRPGEEVLVVNCINRLRHLMDETVVATSAPRTRVLNFMRSLKPHLLVTSVINANHNAPFFVSRFKEAVYYYSSKFDMVESTVEGDSEERAIMEQECMGSCILNVVACEGPERVGRPESYKQWQARLQRAGFRAEPLDAAMLERSRALVRNFYHRDFGVLVEESNRWVLLGWKGRIHEALATWKAKASHVD